MEPTTNIDEASPLKRDFSIEAKAILKAEMKRRGASYATLVALLAEAGVQESEANLRNKISRGNFSAAFFLQVLDVLGTMFLHLDSSQVQTLSGRRRLSGTRFARSKQQFELEQADEDGDPKPPSVR